MHRPTDNPICLARPPRHVLALGAALLAALGLAACHSENKAAEESAKIKIEGDRISLPPGAPQNATFVVEDAKPIEKTILHFTGRLIWNEKKTVPVFSSVAGRVNEIQVNLQQYVSKGDTLATMESPDFGQAQADASKADADMRFSERTLNRVRDLFEHGAAAKKDVEGAQDDFENKKAELQRAMARLKLYGVGIETTVDGLFPLKAPLSGLVVEKRINPGQEVRPDQILANDPNVIKPLFVISDPKRLSVVLDVTELDIGGLKPGQTLQVHTRAYPDRSFEGKLEVIGDSLDPLTRTVNVRGYVDNEEGLLKAEMYVGVDVARIENAEETAPEGKGASVVKSSDPTSPHAGPPVEIPVKAVFTKDNRHFVFVEKSPGQYERQLVELGAEHGGHVSVTSGLTPGARVVTEGSLQLEAMTEGSKD
jgi:cobalt-zinc-cadmium efflux system membrane fusion protein